MIIMKRNYTEIFLIGLVLALFLTACQNEPPSKPSEPKPNITVPKFNRDSAYVYLESQLAFGPRNPGSDGHKNCKDWMVRKFKSYGAEVIEQDFTAVIHTGDRYPSTNIIAQFNPEKKKRVILSAHWDTRYIAEQDPDNKKKEIPIPGADDGGSGVAVLLEIGRLLAENPIDLGIDIILWDAEDQGKRGANQPTELWCLGSQYWSRNPHNKKYKASYGINLDMVGAKNPRFGKDDVSANYAGKVLNKVWSLAQRMGYSDMFVNDSTGGITDDHYFVNTIAGIPMIDIINQPHGSKTGFVDHWHTHGDDINVIDKRSLFVVGQVVLATIYNESNR